MTELEKALQQCQLDAFVRGWLAREERTLRLEGRLIYLQDDLACHLERHVDIDELDDLVDVILAPDEPEDDDSVLEEVGCQLVEGSMMQSEARAALENQVGPATAAVIDLEEQGLGYAYQGENDDLDGSTEAVIEDGAYDEEPRILIVTEHATLRFD